MSMPTPDLTPKRIADRIYLGLFILGMLGGLWASLRGPGTLLGLNCQTLMICAIVFTALAANWLKRENYNMDRACMYAALAIIPIGLRTAFNLTLMTYTASFLGLSLESLMSFAEITAIFSLVAVAEESFRAAVFNLTNALMPPEAKRKIKLPEWAKWLIANGLWVVYHFAQRQFSLKIATLAYATWLFITGIVLCYIMREAGIGAAALAHLLINITA